MKKTSLFLIVFLSFNSLLTGQNPDNTQIKSMLEQYKKDPKGPFKDIRWFCQDGSTRPPQERCPEPGVQRARYKDEVVNLANNSHVYLGQILAATDFKDFWDAENNHSRLKQYQLEGYLKRSDNMWILRKAQYYRGAFQAEDEENWGLDFFKWLLEDDLRIQQNFFLIRESAKDIPHQGDDRKTQLIRSLSKELSDSIPSFLNIRIKIHGQPEQGDIQSVKKYVESNSHLISKSQQIKFSKLISNMESQYQATDLNSLQKYLKNIPKDNDIDRSLQHFISSYPLKTIEEKVATLSGLLWQIREQILSLKKAQQRLALLDISLKLEDILFMDIKKWPNKSLSDLLLKNYYLGMAATGCGYIELWEWDRAKLHIQIQDEGQISMKDLNSRLENSRRLIEWCAGMSRGVYKDVLELYMGFEPLVYGFTDDKVRASILLYLGEGVSDLGEFIAHKAQLTNQVLDIAAQSRIRGINPGYALGELVVINEVTENTLIDGNKIYVFNHPPADLKPVAGIATVTEGNMVSHVQLLARNLGIPNAVLAAENLESLKKYQGKKVFYAVSNKGTVIMKLAEKMTDAEKALFASKIRGEEKLSVPVDKIDLTQNKTLNLREITAKQSGIFCGPKAANLGQLKQMFPDHVVEGFVIPFGIFMKHMEQIIPGKKISYWTFLNNIFHHADEMRKQGETETEVDAYTLGELEILRKEIKTMPLLPEFVKDLEHAFASIFGKSLGDIPVFLRSDTNMEDLKDFTGAGLNLTLFNVAEREKIITGIKDVWASPYSERSYKWRQRYLHNPENIYPSILVIPGVDVDCSGVLITKGISSNQEEDLTIAFSRGAGGAVEGQAAESFLLRDHGENILLSPSREPSYTSLPKSGGTLKKTCTFENQILSDQNIAEIRNFAYKIKQQMLSSDQTKSKGPFDIELGFKNDKIWLFQIRPFVENKKASRSEYLKSISPNLPEGKMFNMKTQI